LGILFSVVFVRYFPRGNTTKAVVDFII
jgi:hypothetical protein